MIDPNEGWKWFAGLFGLVGGSLGLRAYGSRVKREVAKNEAEALHSEGMPDDIKFWRERSEAESKRANDLGLLVERYRADLAYMIPIREERDELRKLAEGQSKIIADVSRQNDGLMAQLRHERSTRRLQTNLLRRHLEKIFPGADLSMLDTSPSPLEDV